MRQSRKWWNEWLHFCTFSFILSHECKKNVLYFAARCHFWINFMKLVVLYFITPPWKKITFISHCIWKSYFVFKMFPVAPSFAISWSFCSWEFFQNTTPIQSVFKYTTHFLTYFILLHECKKCIVFCCMMLFLYQFYEVSHFVFYYTTPKKITFISHRIWKSYFDFKTVPLAPSFSISWSFCSFLRFVSILLFNSKTPPSIYLAFQNTAQKMA